MDDNRMHAYQKYGIFFILFFISFYMYLSTAAPTVAPYRDAGEMATVIPTLGVAHPPGYPLYILSGSVISRMISWGNGAYRLNCFSALAMALCVSLIFLILSRFLSTMSLGLWSAGIFCLLFATANGFWYLSQVSEMYSLNIAACCFLIYLLFYAENDALSLKYIFLFSFAAGLFLGIRLDLVLTYPGFLIIIGYKLFKRKKEFIYCISWCAFLFFLGLSVYLYLYYRSQQKPLINWGNPNTLNKLLEVLSRKSHGHTLDLLSKEYSSGAMFIPEMVLYAKHVFWEFTPIALVFIIWGGYAWIKKYKTIGVSLLCGFFICGPLFIYLSNMPPNPHALAIVEAHYLLPDLFLFLLAGGVLFSCTQAILKPIVTVAIGVSVIGSALFATPRMAMRDNFFAYDYIRNIFHCLPIKSIGVVKEDVQLFSLWYAQYYMKYRNETPMIAQGLSGTQWYQDDMREWYPWLQVMPLRNAEQWSDFIRAYASYPIYMTGDVEWYGGQTLSEMPYGILNYVFVNAQGAFSGTVQSSLAQSEMMKQFMVQRGRYQYEYQLDENRNFFNADLVEEYSSVWRKLGYRYIAAEQYDKAEASFNRATYMKRIIPTVYYHMGYMYFAQNQLDKAESMYAYAIDRYKEYIELTRRYYSLPAVVNNIKREFSEVYVHAGVVRERKQDFEGAIQYFKNAIELNPSSSQAYYNLATVYWKKEAWDAVVFYMEKAVYYDAANNSLRAYLGQARERWRQSGFKKSGESGRGSDPP